MSWKLVKYKKRTKTQGTQKPDNAVEQPLQLPNVLAPETGKNRYSMSINTAQ